MTEDNNTPAPEVPATPIPEAASTETPVRQLDQKAVQDRITLMHWLLGIDMAVRTQGKILVCRPSPAHPWEPCGFVGDSRRQTMNFKFGNFNPAKGDEAQRHYQPFGRDNGDEFFPFDSAKILWSYEYGLATIEAIGAPFQIAPADDASRAKLPKEAQADNFLRTEEELKKLNEVYADITHVFLRHIELEKPIVTQGVKETDLPIEQQLELKDLINTIKYWWMNFGILANAMDKMVGQPLEPGQPGLKADLSNVNDKKLAQIVLNFLRMILDEDALRRQVVTTQVVSSEPKDIVALLGDALNAVSSLTATSGVDEAGNLVRVMTQQPKAIEMVLGNIARVFPSAAAAMKPFEGTPVGVEEIDAVYTALKAQRASLTDVPFTGEDTGNHNKACADAYEQMVGAVEPAAAPVPEVTDLTIDASVAIEPESTPVPPSDPAVDNQPLTGG